MVMSATGVRPLCAVGFAPLDDSFPPRAVAGQRGDARATRLLSPITERLAMPFTRLALSIAFGVALVYALPADANDLVGPGRFCGYAPIIDLLPGEKVTTLQGGIHGGSFRWEGAFGSFEVMGIGWASQPEGQMLN